MAIDLLEDYDQQSYPKDLLANENESKYKPYTPTQKDFDRYQSANNDTSSIGAFLRSAGRAPKEFIANFLPGDHKDLYYPEFLREKPGDIQHPIANFAGHSVWPGAVALKGLGYGGKLLYGLNRLKDIKDLSSIEDQSMQADQAAQLAGENVNQFPSSIPSIKNKMSSLQQKQQGINEQYPSIQGLQFEPEINLSNRLPGATGEDLVPQAQTQRQSYVDQLSHYLGRQETEPMDVQFQNTMNQAIRVGRQQIGQGYNNLKSSFEGKNVSLKKTEPLKEAQSQLSYLVKNSDLNPQETKSLVSELSTTKGDSVPASQILSQFRTADKLSKNAFKKAYERNEFMTEEQRNNAISQAEQYKKIAEKLSEILEEQVNPDFRSELQDLNSAWREHASLYKNPLARKIESGRGITGSNILEQMRGNDIGQQLLRRYTMSNPSSLRAAIGHSYRQNLEQLLNASSYEQQFIQQSEQLPTMLERIQNAQRAEQQAAQEAERLRSEASRVERAYKEDVKREAAKKEAKEAAKQYSDLHEQEKQLLELLKQKEMSLKQKIELSAKLDRVRKDKKLIFGTLKKLGYAVLIAGVGSEAGNLLNKIFK